ncbi:MAG: serine acetyltransferase [Parvularculaceae bacterium]
MNLPPETADWSRERPLRFWDPGAKLLKTIRDYQRLGADAFLGGARRRLVVLRHRFWSVVTAADIPLTVQIGGGLKILHPTGIVIHPDATIGVNCLLMQQATLGAREGVDGVPRLGDHVDVGAGAKLLGPISIGDHARVGSNAVVLINVPTGMTAVGVPARIVPGKRRLETEIIQLAAGTARARQ